MAMTLSSPAFQQNGHIPSKYTCEGQDVSPPLAWEGVPNDAKSLVLIIDDPDAPDPKAPEMVWVHWVVYNIPPGAESLPENVGKTRLPQGALGSMILRRRIMGARVHRLVGTVTSISFTRSKSRSI